MKEGGERTVRPTWEPIMAHRSTSVQKPPKPGQDASAPDKEGAGSSGLSPHLSQKAYLSQGSPGLVCEQCPYDHVLSEYPLRISSKLLY